MLILGHVLRTRRLLRSHLSRVHRINDDSMKKRIEEAKVAGDTKQTQQMYG